MWKRAKENAMKGKQVLLEQGTVECSEVCCIGQDSTEQNSIMWCSAVQYSEVQYCIAQHSTVYFNVVRYGASVIAIDRYSVSYIRFLLNFT